MKFYLERNEKQQCWKIYDMQLYKPMTDPVLLVSISDEIMDRLLMGYCIAQRAIEPWDIKEHV